MGKASWKTYTPPHTRVLLVGDAACIAFVGRVSRQAAWLLVVYVFVGVGSHGDSNQEQSSSEPSSSSRLRLIWRMHFARGGGAPRGWTSGKNFHSGMSRAN
jgi:hypothetical protein